ncbi:AfsR/SARP family transcriptional regulator [Actinoplanes subtropicus]|uniref:AfsR/SARP family transcriptional regulator n=1 Tax=Actinoplanes subtropicus TaxID=543632 RepID=UPI001470533E|nr:BTAD domain-containing putative transcriptional regulator [Actinoplanes subtropicus]
MPIDAVEFRLLGPVGLWRGGRRLGPATAQQRTVLALLLLDLDAVVPTTRISEALWSASPPASERNAVQGYLARLRRLLAEAYPAGELIRTGAGYRLRADRRDVDLYRFRDLVAEARKAGPGDDPLEGALGLWRGPALADVAGEWLPATVRPVLDEERMAALEARLAGELDRGRFDQAVGPLTALVAEHPLRERPVLLLMTALHRAGRTGEALTVFREARRRLIAELGIEPGDDLVELHQRLLGQGGPVPAPPPVPGAEPVMPRQLPAPMPGFVGRRAELAVLDELTSGVAVVCGPPGAGKTSLVVRWAHAVRERFPDGQLFVDMLGFHPGPRRPVAEALALALVAFGVPAERVPVAVDAQVALYRSVLAGRRVLLILDNVADPDQVRQLVPGDPGCLVVATSRDRLSGLVARDGARRLTVDVLPPGDAVEVLAGAAGPAGLGDDPEAARELARLCGHLPLALRIAGARLADRPHAGVREHIAELTARGRMSQLRVDGDDQATVRAAFDLSYRALTPAAGRLFRRLGLVPSPAGLAPPAAAALAGVPEPDLGPLADSLARLHLVRVTERNRLAGHDLLLEYAAELAAEHDEAADRDAAAHRLLHFYLHNADRVSADLNGPPRLGLPREPAPAGVPILEFGDHAQARKWLDAEWANLVAAVEYAAAAGRHRLAWQLAHALHHVLRLQAPPAQWEAVARTGLAAARRDGDPRGETVLRQSLGLLRWRTGDIRGARADFEASAELAAEAGWRVGESAAHCTIGIVLAQLGRPAAAIDRFERAVAIDRELGDRRAEAGSLINLATACEEVGDLARAARHNELAMPLLRDTGQHLGAAIAAENLATIRRELGRLEEARSAAEESLRISREIGGGNEEAAALIALGRVHGEAGRYETAEQALTAALKIAQELPESRLTVSAQTALAELDLRRGRPAEPAERLEPALALAERTGNQRGRVEALLLLAELSAAGGDFPIAQEHAGRAVRDAAAGGYTLLTAAAYARLAAARLGLGDAAGCLADARRALRVQRRAGQRLAYARTLVTMSRAEDLLGRRAQAEAHRRKVAELVSETGAGQDFQWSFSADSRPGDTVPVDL